jgi:hypothetical protein
MIPVVSCPPFIPTVLWLMLLAFDPKPFIESFEATVDRLILLRKEVQAKTEQIEKSVRVAEREYSKKMADLNRGFEVSRTFHLPVPSLSRAGRWYFFLRHGESDERSWADGDQDRCVSTLTYQSINLNCCEGEQLESVHIERQRAQAAYDLIDYYNQFSKDDTSRIDALRKEGKDGRRKVALLLRRLSTVAREVDLPNAEKVRGVVQALAMFVNLSSALTDQREHRQILREV